MNWDITTNEEATKEKQARLDAFVADIAEVCRKHGLTIEHEDSHGAFEIVDGYEGGPSESGLENAHIGFAEGFPK